MSAAVILPLATGSQYRAVAYASTLALIVGLSRLAAGVLKLGFVADLLSRPFGCFTLDGRHARGRVEN
jgi:MFS superfamily sulfate permease-like transporter